MESTQTESRAAGANSNKPRWLHRNNLMATARYVLVMVAGTVIDYLVFLLTYAVIGIPAAQFVARLSGAVAGFFGHKGYTFRSPDWSARRTGKQMVYFALLWICNYLVSTWAIVALVDHRLLAAPLAKIVVELALVPITFLIIRNYIFPTHKAQQATD